MNVKRSNPSENVMPNAELYEQELRFMPYTESLKKVVDLVSQSAPKNGQLVDMMCGTGYLLGQIAKNRPDLNLLGVDIDPRYADYARAKYPKIDFEVGDVLTWNPGRRFDMVTCTGALHHVPYDKQDAAVQNIASLVKRRPYGLAVISDCYIDDYKSELERRLAAAELGYEYLIATMKNGASQPVNGVLVDIMKNDVLMDEFKTSIYKREDVFHNHFGIVQTLKVWPNAETQLKSGFGDYISILLRPKETKK